MKKNILYIISLLLQFLLIVFCCVPQLKNLVINNVSFIYDIFIWYKNCANSFASLIHIDVLFKSLPLRFTLTVSLLIINLIIFIIYRFIVFIICLMAKRKHKKVLNANKLDAYSLSEEEKAKFNWKLYQKHFHLFAILSFVIPTLLILFFIFLRYDKQICLLDKNNKGFTLIYSKSLSPFINSILPGFNKWIINFINNYITLLNSAIDVIKISWIEYVILSVIGVLIYLLWFFFVWLFIKIFNRIGAKKRAKKAKHKYIAKMEKLELKARKKAGERISSKAVDLGISSKETMSYDEDVSIIAIQNNDSSPKSFSDIRNAEYIDDLATGVIDLGVASSGEEEDKEPIEKRIPIFVGDEDIDIILDKEPVIETIEEEKDYDEFEEEIFFERYEQVEDEFDLLDDTLLENQVEIVDEEKDLKTNKIEIKQFDITKYIVEENHKETNNVLEKNDNETKKDDIELIEDIEEQLNIEQSVNKNENKKRFKKPTKPIEIISKFNENERFKRPNEKYLDIIRKKERENIISKKRNYIRRKYKKGYKE